MAATTEGGFGGRPPWIEDEDSEPGVPLRVRAGKAVQFAAAAVSLSLLVGVGVWGYRLLVRDATGIPVVRAMQGPLRERPATPGGEVALHTGLAVNEVAAEGGAAPTEESMVLAPAGVGLSEEDLAAAPVVEQPEDEAALAEAAGGATGTPEETLVTPVSFRVGEDQSPMSTDEILALADRVAEGETPLSGLPPEEVASGPGEPEPVELIPASVPGVARALRPPTRPASAVARAVAPVVDIEAALASVVPVSSAPVPLGTTLVQLGAYPSTAAATEAWARVANRFADFIVGREPVIQQAESGGQTFYRLRATGFADLADARRFCSALVAEEADCIPVVVR